MATNLRRNPTAPNDQTTRLLYSVLKQLDIRSIDWTQVAHDMGISNGHAARMRYSRFKQQMEGTYMPARRPAATVKTAAGGKKRGPKDIDERPVKKVDMRRKSGDPDIKREDPEGGAHVKVEDSDEDVPVKSEEAYVMEEEVKAEPTEDALQAFEQAIWG